MRLVLAFVAAAMCAQAQLPTPLPVPQSAKYRPTWIGTVDAGGIAPGHGGTFAAWSASRYLGQDAYATVINEYRLSKGQVLTCTMAGVSKVIFDLGPMQAGLTGAGGGCSGTPSGANTAASGQGFLNFHVWHSLNIPITVRKTYTASSTAAFTFSLGIAWGQ